MTWYEEVDMRLWDNRSMFLSLISHSEGTDKYGDDEGYNVIVGGSLFHDYSDHPRKRVWIESIQNYSTAAGRYQILERYYDHYKKQLGLPDFGHDSQDRIALQLIRECKALDDIDNGDIESAIIKCSSRWASFPGAGYNQPEHDMETLLSFFKKIGGYVND